MNKKIFFWGSLIPLMATPALFVASCSDSKSDDLNNALKNIKAVLDENEYTRITKKASEVELNSLPVFDPSQIFGFKMEWEDFSSVEEENYNDNEGLRIANLILTRGQEKYVQKANIQGYLKNINERDEASEPDIKILELLNLENPKTEQPKVLLEIKDDIKNSLTFGNAFNTLKNLSNSDDLTKAITKLIYLNKDDVPSESKNKSLFKETIPKDVKLKFFNLRQAKFLRIPTNYLTVDLALSKKTEEKTKTSRLIKIFISGWKNEKAEFQTEKTIKDWFEPLASINSPIDYEKSKNKLASQIKNLEELKTFFKTGYNIINSMNVDFLELKKETADDATGSIDVLVKIQFSDNDKISATKVIKLFGFKQIENKL